VAEIISLDFLRTSKPLRECLREVIAKLQKWTVRQKELEQLIWCVEHGIPVSLGDQGGPIEQAAAREKLARDLYQAIANQQTLKMYRSHLRQCIRAAAAGKGKKVAAILERAHAIGGGASTWDTYIARGSGVRQ
jgi:hypothetical protein